MDPEAIDALNEIGVDLRLDEPLVKKTWWRVGGPAQAYAEVGSVADLQAVRRTATHHKVPLFVLGNASNLLISDAGIPGLVVRLVGGLAQIDAREGELVLGGGLKLVGFVRQAMRHGWTGLEMLAGIPGTVGGAVTMNAGTRLGEISDRLISATLVLASGEVVETDDLGLAYRSSTLPPGSIVAAARVRTTDADPDQSRALVEEHLAYRARTQPTDVPTCGSTFRNPEGDHAGRLIEAAGLKGFTVGAAQVSPKHANFLVNLGGARATDLRRLIETIQTEVHAMFGVSLQTEVHYAGTWPSSPATAVTAPH